MPAGVTGLIQPWDVYGFRLWKNYVRHLGDFMLLHDIDIVISQRNNTLKLMSLLHHQMSSPRYKATWAYSWYKAGLVDKRPDTFLNPVDFAFKSGELECNICGELRMANCSWCSLALCAQHFFIDCHNTCDTFVE